MDVIRKETTHDLPSLHFDLIHKILLWLPATSLVRLKCVSKSWYHVINSPDFIKLNLSHSLKSNSNKSLILYAHNSLYSLYFHDLSCRVTELPYHQVMANFASPQQHDFKVTGSCNGLICFRFRDNNLALYNPATRACKVLPQLNFKRLSSEAEFFYDCMSDDYKVLRFAELRNPRETFLYSLKINAWERILGPPWDWHWKSVKFPGILVNNTLHWMDREHKDIKCFDLSTRRYYVLLLPKKVSPTYFPLLAVLKGELFVVTYYFDIWVMKEYGVEESWTRLFRCPSTQWNDIYKSASSGCLSWGCELSIACSKDGCKILVGCLRGPRNFICCDLQSQEASEVEIPSLLPKRFSAILPWVESLIPLSN
ncbi:F-box protein CPR1-like [Beta vulgaris subsp. vulgaris]|uniref:F-box protein CPR1-like n=1 Tax=Beta vulgaris subsp. vulgaris TaxID=3555 RepID=UPI00254830B7|nr:F-box protein CPR1-like [Beta vulgaris subsp. vulgaris]